MENKIILIMKGNHTDLLNHIITFLKEIIKITGDF